MIEPMGWFIASRVIDVTNPIGRKVRDRFLNPPRGIPRGPGATAELNDSSVVQVERTAGTKDGAPHLEGGTVLDVSNVVWSTGFVAAYDWIDLPVCGEYGYPIHDRGVVESQPGLYSMGLRWLALDRPGFGLSEPIDWSNQDFASTVVDVQRGVLDALGLERVSLLGHSIGNTWALRLASTTRTRSRSGWAPSSPTDIVGEDEQVLAGAKGLCDQAGIEFEHFDDSLDQPDR